MMARLLDSHSHHFASPPQALTPATSHPLPTPSVAAMGAGVSLPEALRIITQDARSSIPHIAPQLPTAARQLGPPHLHHCNSELGA